MREGAADCGRGVSGAGHGRPRRPRSPPARPQPSPLNPGGVWSGLVWSRAVPCPLPRRLAFIPARCSPRGWGQHLPTPSPAPPGPRAPALSPPASLRRRGRSPAGSREPTAQLRDPPAPKSFRASPSPPHRGGWMPGGGSAALPESGAGARHRPCLGPSPPGAGRAPKTPKGSENRRGPCEPQPRQPAVSPGRRGGRQQARPAAPAVYITLGGGGGREMR